MAGNNDRAGRLIPEYFRSYAGESINPDSKRAVLAHVNQQMGTQYKITTMNQWIAGTKRMPERLQNRMRRQILVDRLGDDSGNEIADLLDLE